MSSRTTPRSAWGRQAWTALRALVLFTIVLGIGYPALVLGIGQLALPAQANGSLASVGGQVVGSRLLGQSFSAADGTPLAQWFQPRPSAAGARGYDAGASSGSNLGPNNPTLLQSVRDRMTALAAADGVDPARIPADALTASASGLDPHISPAYAQEQVHRVAAARGLPDATVQALVDARIQGRDLGYLGEPTVNVLELNIALAGLGG